MRYELSLFLVLVLLSSCTTNKKNDPPKEGLAVKNKSVNENYFFVSKDSSNILFDCHEVDSIYSINDRCLLIDYLIANKWRTVFCLNKIITTFQVEAGIKSRATFSDLNGYFYNSEKVLLEDLRKYKKAYKCY